MRTLFENIVRKTLILKEDAQVDKISGAISGLHPVIMRYDDNKGGTGKNKRVIYPVAYGISTAGNPVVRAYQKQGSTKTASPSWKLFRLDRMKNWRVITSKTFNPSELVGFRTDGDEQIATLYTIAPVGKAQSGEFNGNYVKLKSTPVTKDDIEAEKDPQAAAMAQAKQSAQQQSGEDIVNDIVNNIDQKENGKTIDNANSDGYNNEKWQEYKMNATDTDPVYKGEIPGGDKPVGIPGAASQQNQSQIGDEPITKDELEAGNNEPENNNDNPAVDLTKRMDNLYKEND